MYEPSESDAARAYEAGEPLLVSTRLVADLETPVSAFLKVSAGRAGNVFLLESVEGGAARGRSARAPRRGRLGIPRSVALAGWRGRRSAPGLPGR